MLAFCVAFWYIIDALITHIDVRKNMRYTFFIYALHLDVQAVFTKIVYYLGLKKYGWHFPTCWFHFAQLWQQL